MRSRRPILLGLLVVLILTGCRSSAGARTFEHEAFAFVIPVGWKTKAEVWGRSASAGEEYYGLGVREIVTIQYPARRGQGEAFFAVASSPLGDGESLESRFVRAYEEAVPEIRDAVQRPFERGELSGYEITYRRPWGEPWWQFQDVWVERDGVVYVLSFHTYPGDFESY
ncbi:MAG: hypothetical protein H5T61_11070, partial [Thermoflexales bacterium]|nr:hypothetical protein [Thermoflexales bacterium]